MNAKTCLALVGTTLLFAGCVSVKKMEPVPMAPARVEAQAKPTDYSVEILVLDVGKNSRKLLFSHPDENLQKVLADAETTMTRVPILYVTPGTNAVLDERKVYRYPMEFDAQGQPLSFTNRAVGSMTRAELTADKSGALQISVTVEDNILRRVESIKTPGKDVYERPVVEPRLSRGSTPIMAGQWAVVSSDPFVVPNKAKPSGAPDQFWRVVLVKVQPPKAK
jgi:hypothetical protein